MSQGEAGTQVVAASSGSAGGAALGDTALGTL